MTWLIWKDFRLNRLVWGVALFLLVVPYIVAAILAWYVEGQVTQSEPRGLSYLMGAAFQSLIVMQIVMAFAGGNAIAGERMDRSAEFLASLPVPRSRILASKLLATLGLAAFVWIPNALFLAIAYQYLSPPTAASLSAQKTGFLLMFVNMAATGLTFFCVAWMFSAILESPTFSVCAGLITPLVIIGTVAWVNYLLDVPNIYTAFAYLALCLGLSVSCFTGGTVYYLRRVEP